MRWRDSPHAMIRKLLLPLFSLACASSLLGDTVAYWNFNSLSIATASAPGAGGVPTTIAANQGAGTVSLTGWTGLVAKLIQQSG